MIIPVIDAASYNCVDRSVRTTPCYGAQCMGWRWTDTRRVYGYCGMAGVPVSSVREKEKDEC